MDDLQTRALACNPWTCPTTAGGVIPELVAEIDRLAAILAEIDTPHAVVLTEDSWFTEHDIACRRARTRALEMSDRLLLLRPVMAIPMAVLLDDLVAEIDHLTVENERLRRG